MTILTSNDVNSAIAECFATDEELISKWHISAGNGLEACIERTIQDVKTFHPSFRFYRVYEGKELAAYWGTELDFYINLIFVKPHFRTKEFMLHFWDAVKDSVNSPFYTVVYSKNKPALDFYGKLGQKLSEFEFEGNRLTEFEFTKDGDFLCLQV